MCQCSKIVIFLFESKEVDQVLPFLNTTSGEVVCYSGTQDGGEPGPDNIFIMYVRIFYPLSSRAGQSRY